MTAILKQRGGSNFSFFAQIMIILHGTIFFFFLASKTNSFEETFYDFVILLSECLTKVQSSKNYGLFLGFLKVSSLLDMEFMVQIYLLILQP